MGAVADRSRNSRREQNGPTPRETHYLLIRCDSRAGNTASHRGARPAVLDTAGDRAATTADLDAHTGLAASACPRRVRHGRTDARCPFSVTGITTGGVQAGHVARPHGWHFRDDDSDRRASLRSNGSVDRAGSATTSAGCRAGGWDAAFALSRSGSRGLDGAENLRSLPLAEQVGGQDRHNGGRLASAVWPNGQTGNSRLWTIS